MTSVFISHSTPDPASTGDQELRDHRRWMQALRDAVRATLKARGVEPWLDKRQLGAGDDWRDGIHEGLARANGAVLLISKDALNSKWVTKEVTILTWLRAIQVPVTIIPVFIGVSTSDVQAKWGPLLLTEIQAMRVDLDPMADATDAARRIVDGLLGKLHVGDMETTLFDGWVATLAGYIAKAPHENVSLMLKELGLCEAKIAPNALLEALRHVPHWAVSDAKTEVAKCVAREFLTTDDARVIRALEQIQYDALGRRRFFYESLRPVWFPGDQAMAVPRVGYDRDRRVVIVNAKDPATGAALATAGHFTKINRSKQIIAPAEPEGLQSPSKIVDYYVDQVAQAHGSDLDRALQFAQTYPIYVVVGRQVVNGNGNVDALLHSDLLRPFKLVLLAGDSAATVRAECACVAAEADLGPEADDRYSYFDSNLLDVLRPDEPDR